MRADVKRTNADYLSKWESSEAVKLSNLHHGRMRGGPKPLFCQTPRVKITKSLQDSNSLPRDSEPLNLAFQPND